MIRIYGISDRLNPIKERLSDVINSCMVDARSFPEDKRAHRFIPLSSDDFFYTHGRTDQYTVIEINMMKGRTEEAKKRLIHLLFERMEQKLSISPVDVEITIQESPPCNWGFWGITGDEAKLSYPVDV